MSASKGQEMLLVGRESARVELQTITIQLANRYNILNVRWDIDRMVGMEPVVLVETEEPAAALAASRKGERRQKWAESAKLEPCHLTDSTQSAVHTAMQHKNCCTEATMEVRDSTSAAVGARAIRAHLEQQRWYTSADTKAAACTYSIVAWATVVEAMAKLVLLQSSQEQVRCAARPLRCSTT
jgi:hypothetical protein